ncbi:MAG: mechanosensitive ion channel family protein [Candidatus Eisenbacteria bacterium]
MPDLLDNLTSPWIVGPLVFVVWCIGLTIVMRVLYGRLRHLSTHTATDIDDVIVGALRMPAVLVILVTGGLILGRILPLSPEWDKAFGLGVRIAVILAGVLFVDGLIKALLHRAARKAAFLQTSSGIVQTAVRGVIILIALLIVLDTAGVSITPIVASLGVGSLAVALALQSPLANFFAGIQILADRPVEVGQYIELDTGQKGYVTKIGWRSTTIRILPNNLVIVPNSTIMSAIITNYYLPEKQLSILVDVGVHYDSDLEHVEKVTCEVAKEVLQDVEGGKKDFDPFIRYHTFGDFSINFTVILRVEEFVNGYLVKHEFVKRLHRRFKQEGIIIPFPIRTLDIHKEDLLFLKQGGPSG